jgi:hypothetical protein
MLETTNAITIKWWIDTSFTMHLDMKSHTGGTMSLVKGICVLALPKAVYQHKKLDGSRTCQSR